MRRTEVHDRLASVLRAMREGAGVSQRELARRLGTNQTQVSLIESGDQAVRVVELVEWCRALEADPQEAFARALRSDPP